MNYSNYLKAALLIGAFGVQTGFAQTEKETEKESQQDSPFSFEASYVGDVAGNFSGGIKTGTAYLGKAELHLGFDTEKAGWWKGGSFFINGGNTHGDTPSATLIGDFQVLSNIEAGHHTYLYELWYKQQIGNVSISAGLQDLNTNYAASEDGSLFNNSFFGIHSVFADNVLAPIFPLTALGLDVHWDITDDYHWQAVIFDGVPDDFETNPYNTRWSLSSNDGFLAVTEFQVHKSLLNGRKGVYKIGAYLHDSEIIENDKRKNYGFYFVGNQDLNNQLSLFAQLGVSPKKWNNHYQCYGLGLDWKNFSTKRPDDVAGIAFNHARFDKSANGNETVIEAIYRFQLNKNIYLCPDIQYVINPAGTDQKLDNALVGMLRFGIDF